MNFNKLLISFFLILASHLLPAQTTQPAGTPGEISHDRWNGVVGYQVAELLNNTIFNQVPDYCGVLNTIELSNTDDGSDFGERVRGYLTAPITGEYRFWLSADDQATVWLSPDEDKFKKQVLVEAKSHSPFQRIGFVREQTSNLVALQAGQKYYIEAILKEAESADHLSLYWSYSESNLKNWALESGVSATQSTTESTADASKAIDGNTSGILADGSISQTQNIAES